MVSGPASLSGGKTTRAWGPGCPSNSPRPLTGTSPLRPLPHDRLSRASDRTVRLRTGLRIMVPSLLALVLVDGVEHAAVGEELPLRLVPVADDGRDGEQV